MAATLSLRSTTEDETDTFQLRAAQPDDACVAPACGLSTPIMLEATGYTPDHVLLCMRHVDLADLRIDD